MLAKQLSTFIGSEEKVSSEAIAKEMVKEIWLDLLKLSYNNISYDENFFLLGGDSLSLAQVLLRLQTKLGLELSLMELYQVLTINKMAAYCQKKQREDLSSLPDASHLIHEWVSESYPASAAQCGLWFIEQLQSENISLYNTGLEVEIKGRLNTGYLVQAYAQVIRRHPVLNASFGMDSSNKQLLLKPSTSNVLALTVLDSSTSGVENAAKSLVQRQLNLSTSPMIYGVLHKLTKSRHVLQIYVHHVVTDGWSGKLLLEGVFRRYKELIDVLTPDERAVNKDYYREYCLWQRGFLASDACIRQIAYWQKKLQNVSNTLPLFNNQAYAEYQNESFYMTGRSHSYIGRNLFASINECSVQYSFSRFTLCLAAFTLLLSKDSGNRDFCLGLPVANRKYQRWEQAIGYFVNLLVLRNTIQHDISVLDYLSRQQFLVLEALENQDLPFQEVISSLGLSGREKPLFDVLFCFHKDNVVLPVLEGLAVSYKEIKKSHQHYKLLINITEKDGFLECVLEYAKNLFSKQEMDIMLVKFEQALEEIVRTPSMKLSDLFHVLEEPYSH